MPADHVTPSEITRHLTLAEKYAEDADRHGDPEDFGLDTRLAQRYARLAEMHYVAAQAWLAVRPLAQELGLRQAYEKG